jgi:hypothetical protein
LDTIFSHPEAYRPQHRFGGPGGVAISGEFWIFNFENMDLQLRSESHTYIHIHLKDIVNMCIICIYICNIRYSLLYHHAASLRWARGGRYFRWFKILKYSSANWWLYWPI